MHQIAPHEAFVGQSDRSARVSRLFASRREENLVFCNGKDPAV